MPSTIVIACAEDRTAPSQLHALDGLDVTLHASHAVDTPAARELLARADAVIVEMHPFNAALIAGMPRCRIIACASTGFDYIDSAAAARQGMWVSNSPDYCTDEVATHTVALLLNQVRRLPQLRALARAGTWNPRPIRPLPQLRGQTLGLIGCGRIGRAVAAKAQALGMRVLGHDPYVAAEQLRALGIEPAERAQLLSASDYVSLHVPLNAETRGLFDAQCCAQMRPGAYLINTSRGPVVDEAALLAAVQAGQIGGAALDVLATEPPPADHPFLHDDRFFITPHSAWCSEASDQAVWERAATNVADVLRGARPYAAVNQPA